MAPSESPASSAKNFQERAKGWATLIVACAAAATSVYSAVRRPEAATVKSAYEVIAAKVDKQDEHLDELSRQIVAIATYQKDKAEFDVRLEEARQAASRAPVARPVARPAATTTVMPMLDVAARPPIPPAPPSAPVELKRLPDFAAVVKP